MEAITKRKLTENEIDFIIQKALGSKVSEFKELTDGMANSAYSVSMSDGNAVILKVAPAAEIRMMRYERNIMSAEVEVLRLIGSMGTIPVPKVFAYDPSCTDIDSEYFIMEQLRGTPYNKIKDALSQDERNAVEYQLGVYNRLINEIPGEHFGLYTQKDSWKKTWAEAFQSMFMNVLADGKDARVELPVAYNVIENEINCHLDVLREVEQPRLVHWDLWDGNVFVDDQGKISGIIDFERALWGDTLIEHYFCHFSRSDAFYEGYNFRIETVNQRKRRAFYDLYLDLIMWVECTYRQYDDEGYLKWAYGNVAEGWDRFLAVMSESS